MIRPNFLAFLPDPFGTGSQRLLLRTQAGEVRNIGLGELAETPEAVVTYNAWQLFDEFRAADLIPISPVIDLRFALKQLSGLARDQGGERSWDVWRALRKQSSKPEIIQKLRDLVMGRADLGDDLTVDALLQEACSSLASLWEEILAQLKMRGELDRFFSIEVPIQYIFSLRQIDGVPVNKPALHAMLDQARAEKYSAYRELAQQLSFAPSGVNYWSISRHLANTDAKHVIPIVKDGSAEEPLRLASHTSTFARAFTQYMDAERALSALTRLGAHGDHVHPLFDTFGTVTGRITIEDPQLQYLPKRFRPAIGSTNGYVSFYLDYSQFEPGILASLSRDDALIEDFGQRDLYKALSQRIFGSPDSRSICKKIFLSYCYGMSSDNIARTLMGPSQNGNMLGDANKAIVDFFSNYPAVDDFRKQCQLELIALGHIDTLDGNRRYRTRDGSLSSKEKRWSMNHRIQGTASAIFKDAVIRVFNQFGRKTIIAPIHDAMLLQFEDDKEAGEKATLAAELMRETFVKWCPNVRPRVSVEAIAR